MLNFFEVFKKDAPDHSFFGNPRNEPEFIPTHEIHQFFLILISGMVSRLFVTNFIYEKRIQR
jgi:hypothetical protein